eukprot:4285184-Pleurochrysis_carterae.AAC.1
MRVRVQTATPADGSASKPLERVNVGELLLIRPGEAVPVDGTVTAGASSVRTHGARRRDRLMFGRGLLLLRLCATRA